MTTCHEHKQSCTADVGIREFVTFAVFGVDLHNNGKTSLQEGQSVVDCQSLRPFLKE